MTNSILDTELFEVMKNPVMPIEVIRKAISDRFELDRKYLSYSIKDDQLEFFTHEYEVSWDFDIWTLTSLYGWTGDSFIDIELKIEPTGIRCTEPRSIEMRIYEQIDGDSGTITLIARKEIKVLRHLNEFLDQLPALLDEQHQLISQRHYQFCLEEYAVIGKRFKPAVSKKQLREYSEQIVANSIYPLVDKTK